VNFFSNLKKGKEGYFYLSLVAVACWISVSSFCMFLEEIILRWIVVGKLKEGEYKLYRFK
jgi:hypothetical protein